MPSFQEFKIPDVKLISLDRHTDHRGWINESWRDSWNDTLGTNVHFVQDMWTFNEHAYTLRGLHALNSPAQQHKLVIVLKGDVFDVVVDARKDSHTYGQHISVMLSGNLPQVLLIPPGCYHGYLTLTPDTIMGYKVDKYHCKDLDSGINWADPDLDISWPLTHNLPIISDRDRNHPRFYQA